MSESKLAISTSIFKDFNPPEHLSLLAKSDIYRVELSVNCFYDLKEESRFAQIMNICKLNGITVHSIHAPFSADMDISSPDKTKRLKTIDAIFLCIDRLASLQGSYLVIHPSYEPIEENQRRHRLDV